MFVFRNYWGSNKESDIGESIFRETKNGEVYNSSPQKICYSIKVIRYSKKKVISYFVKNCIYK